MHVRIKYNLRETSESLAGNKHVTDCRWDALAI